MGLRWQTALDLLYPPQCVTCDTLVTDRGGLCGPCWRDTPFILGLACDLCGQPLPGASDRAEHCDACRSAGRPWRRGGAAMAYRDRGRRLAMGLKHSDRTDIALAAAPWIDRAAPHQAGQIIVPVPIHWRRMASRRYNQAALLAQALGRRRGEPVALRALVRTRATPPQKGPGLDERFANLEGAIAPHPRHGAAVSGRPVLLIDDVMTSGATLAAAAEALAAAGAASIHMAVLARAIRDL